MQTERRSTRISVYHPGREPVQCGPVLSEHIQVMALNETEWFTETQEKTGTAFSLRIHKRLHSEKSPYQQIDIYETTDFGRLMVLDGCTMVSDRDNFLYHEMMTHPALFTHPAARRVAVIGGGDCGTLREVLRHDSVEKAWQIEIDERVTRLSEQYFPALCEANDDPRAELLFEDGIAWMQACEPESLDLIIIDSTDPVGPAEGLFNLAFYQSCLAALKPGGLLVGQTESPLLHLELMVEVHHTLLQAGFQAVRPLLFPQPIYPSGWWSATLARKAADLNGFREMGAASKGFATRYYSVETHKAALAIPPFLQQALQAPGKA